MTYKQRECKQECVAAMRAHAQHNKLPQHTVAEYVREAEHQEGLDYWLGFTPEQAVEDLQLYVDNL